MKKLVKKKVKLSLIDPPGSSVRFEIPERDIFELSESIKEVGLLQPLLLVPRGDRYEVVAGDRRRLACIELNLDEIDCSIGSFTNEEVAIIRATENLQRANLSKIEEGKIYVNLHDEEGLTLNQIATKMGRSASHIKRYMDLLRFDEQIIQALHQDKISIAVAEQLERIPDRKEKLRYLEIAAENGASAPVVKMWVDDLRKALQYINSSEELPPPQIDYIEQKAYYATCEMCDGPVEYKDVKIIRVCRDCYRTLLSAISANKPQGN